MRAVFSIHDQPQIYLSATRRASLVELGLRGERESVQAGFIMRKVSDLANTCLRHLASARERFF